MYNITYYFIKVVQYIITPKRPIFLMNLLRCENGHNRISRLDN